MRVFYRLHRFILKSFLPLFAMTFFIVLFIVLMQFLWKYIDDMVGKGLSIDVLAELFFYAAVSMVPMSLPLAILLASLMTFGNLGEKFELTAIKASGISLLRIMAPLIVFISMVAVGAFYFQNNVLPKAQVKMWTLLFSMRQKSPEVEIPVGVFYDQIPGYNLFILDKNKDTGMLYDVMIYDVNSGGDNSVILRADSAKMAFTKGMDHLYLHLYKGEQFENLRSTSALDSYVPFRRENFTDKEILIPFDANFNRIDEQGMRAQYVGKNITELRASIDSVSARVDSIGSEYATELLTLPVVGISAGVNPKTGAPEAYKPVKMPQKILSLDTLLANMNPAQRNRLFDKAKSSLRQRQADYEFKELTLTDDQKSIRRHQIELIKKYTLSIACLIMFFIGAPLGAIIRKGGIGTPLVISVLLFLVYYIIDNTGYKLARDGHWIVWCGMWLSTFILAPLGIYVTYKAMNDSAVFDKDAYINFFRKFFGIKSARKVEYKEVIINDIDISTGIEMLESLRIRCNAFLEANKKPQSYISFWLDGYDTAAIHQISEELEHTVDYLRDCRSKLVVNKLMDFPVIRDLWVYRPSLNRRWLGIVMIILFPIGLPVWLIGLKAQSSLKAELRKTSATTEEIAPMLEDATE